jgi:hypothetical protein
MRNVATLEMAIVSLGYSDGGTGRLLGRQEWVMNTEEK